MRKMYLSFVFALLPLIMFAQGSEMITPQIGGFITERGALAMRAWVSGNDTVYSGMLLEIDPTTRAADSLKVRRARPGTQTVVGVAYVTGCDTCRISDGQIFVITSGIAKTLMTPSDTILGIVPDEFVTVNIDAAFPGFAHATGTPPTIGAGKTLSKQFIQNAEGASYLPSINNNVWRRYYCFVFVKAAQK